MALWAKTTMMGKQTHSQHFGIGYNNWPGPGGPGPQPALPAPDNNAIPVDPAHVPIIHGNPGGRLPGNADPMVFGGGAGGECPQLRRRRRDNIVDDDDYIPVDEEYDS